MVLLAMYAIAELGFLDEDFAPDAGSRTVVRGRHTLYYGDFSRIEHVLEDSPKVPS